MRYAPFDGRLIGLDLCCGAGGATRGYQQAGFRMVGVDYLPQPNYCGERFIQADLGFETDEETGEFTDVALFDLGALVAELRPAFVHASFPCQLFTALNQGNKGREKQVGSSGHVDLITPNRPRLAAIAELGIPVVWENVPSAPIRRDVQLCGEMFHGSRRLAVIRHRNFELNGWTAPQPQHLRHRGRVAGWRHGEWFDGPYFAVYGDGGGKGSVAQWQSAMGIDWTDVRLEIAEAIPPAYTEYLGAHLMAHLLQVRAMAMTAVAA